MTAQRIKYQYRVIDKRAGQNQPPLLAVSIHHGVVRRDTLTDDLPRAEDLSNYKVCESGDIVLNRMRAFQGAIGISSQRGLVSPDYLVLRPGPDVDPRYLHHLFRSTWFIGEMVSRLRGIGNTENGSVRTPRINPEDLGDIPVDFPSFDEQRRVVDFLDAETARIDRIISIRQQQAAVGAQRFCQIVDGVVTGNAEALAEIDYGKASAAWGVGKIGRLFDIIPGFTFPSKDFVETEFGTRLLRGINVTPGRIDWDVETVAWDLESSPIDRRFHLRIDDLVIGMDRPWIGSGARVALIREIDLPSLLLQRVACIRSRGTSTRYLRWVLGSSHFRLALEGETTGVSVPHISGDQIGAFTYRLPSPDEQELLSALIQSHDDLRATQAELVDRQLVVLAERRQALITAAVTGQIDVTTARRVVPSGGGAAI
jgi:type I restriction enzyme, S subunit